MILNNGSYTSHPISKQDIFSLFPRMDNWRLAFTSEIVFFKSSVQKSVFMFVERLV